MSKYDPETTGYELIKQIFGYFGFGSEEIPAWNLEKNEFEFEKLGKVA